VADYLRRREEEKRLELKEAEQARQNSVLYERQQQLNKLQEYGQNKKWKELTREQVEERRALEEKRRCEERQLEEERRAFGLYRLRLAEAELQRHADTLRRSRQRSDAACARLAELTAAAGDQERAAERTGAAAAAGHRQAQGRRREAEREAARAALDSTVRRAWSADRRDRQQRLREEAERTRREALAREQRNARLAAELDWLRQRAASRGAGCRRQWRQQKKEADASIIKEAELEFKQSQEVDRATRREQEEYENRLKRETDRLRKNDRSIIPLKAQARVPAPGFDYVAKSKAQQYES
ncbi:vicilin-like seed storage protein At2g18540, partial [Amphibalanus amphitrite]|uniref:vicilin-like seed storage protein At2g18540 n=1 Tax=Amphibalanus amphitrite TaxID=1232801 RepID=UPI001C904928